MIVASLEIIKTKYFLTKSGSYQCHKWVWPDVCSEMIQVLLQVPRSIIVQRLPNGFLQAYVKVRHKSNMPTVHYPVHTHTHTHTHTLMH